MPISTSNPAVPQYPAGCSHVERSCVSLLGEEIVLRQKAQLSGWQLADPIYQGSKGYPMDMKGYNLTKKQGILSIPNRKMAVNGYDDEKPMDPQVW